jgi:hypothetical protein
VSARQKLIALVGSFAGPVSADCQVPSQLTISLFPSLVGGVIAKVLQANCGVSLGSEARRGYERRREKAEGRQGSEYRRSLGVIIMVRGFSREEEKLK